jgi:tetratricopeptide (TPR) repeat protein
MKTWLASIKGSVNRSFDRALMRGLEKSSGQEVRRSFEFSSKHPKLKVMGLAQSCQAMLDQNDLQAAKAVADEIRTVATTQRRAHKATRVALNVAAKAYERNGDYASAVEVSEFVLAFERDCHGADSKEAAQATESLAMALAKADRTSEAVDLHRGALDWWKQNEGLGSPNTIKAAERLGIALCKDGDFAAAEETLARVVRSMEASNLDVKNARSWLGVALAKQGKRPESE